MGPWCPHPLGGLAEVIEMHRKAQTVTIFLQKVPRGAFRRRVLEAPVLMAEGLTTTPAPA